MRAFLERFVAEAWPPRCPECRTPMILERDTQVSATPPVFEASWVCVACGGTARRCRVFEAIH